MSVLTPGANAPVPNSTVTAIVRYAVVPGISLDVSAFPLSANGKVRDDAEFCFYGAPSTLGGAVTISSASPGITVFSLDLPRLPGDIEKIALTATIDENRARFEVVPSLEVSVEGGITAPIETAGRRETALILGEFYRRNGEWKYRSIAQGFEGGLEPLATHYGVVVEQTPPAPVAKPRISLEKKIEAAAPKLISLAKTATVSLAKANLTTEQAVVYLVLDKSGSMDWQYADGRVQELVRRMVPLAVHFDDNGELDTWAFGTVGVKLSNVTLRNYDDFVKTDSGGWKQWKTLGKSNNEPDVIDKVIAFHKASGSTLPALVIFVSDGGIDKTREIRERIVEAAKLPIFWQFAGIGGRNYGILKKLDELEGRVVDNAGFFEIDDLYKVTEEQLYDRLMGEFPQWLKAARAKGILAS